VKRDRPTQLQISAFSIQLPLRQVNKSHSWWWDPSYRRLSPWPLRNCVYF